MGRRMLTKSTGIFWEIKNKQNSNLMNRELLHLKDQNVHMKGPEARSAESALWMPHPRTGIYYPKGFEWVMEDVPDGAASFQKSYWLRSSEIEKPSSSTSNDGVVFDHPFV